MATSRADITMGTDGTLHEIDWDNEDLFWRDAYGSRPYASAGLGYDEVRPAYRYGVESALRHRGRRWDEVEPELERGWEAARGASRLAWERARSAVQDAWNRVRS